MDNLRLNATYKTSGFVEVRSIKCIEGKYPKKLVELWKTYDDNKTSDNDCPSIFDENQLYIALELGDGGEDLEAFVFQTAEEACALFLQVRQVYICLFSDDYISSSIIHPFEFSFVFYRLHQH